MISTKGLIKYVNAIAPYNPSATGTTSGDVVDISGFRSVTLLVQAGAQTTTSITLTPVVLHGTVSGTLTSAPDTDLDATEASAASELAGAAGAKGIGRIGYVGKNRFVKARAILVGATTGYYGAMWALSDPILQPQSQ
jgi:hypothetical protein